MYSIYKIWNEVNDKLYIGCTIRPIEEQLMTKHKLTEDQLSQNLQWYEQTENIQF